MNPLGRFVKLPRFIGMPWVDSPPGFVNSMPKAGTNLVEDFLVELGLKRKVARCLNETNAPRVTLRPSRGRFYIGHLADDAIIHSVAQAKVFVTRRLGKCLRSYVNYMRIDKSHQVSKFVGERPTFDVLQKLFFTADNPNRRPLVDEYLRFFRLDWDKYDVVIEYEKLVSADAGLLSSLSSCLGVDVVTIERALSRAMGNSSYTRNLGSVDVFSGLTSAQSQALDAEFEKAERAGRVIQHQ